MPVASLVVTTKYVTPWSPSLPVEKISLEGRKRKSPTLQISPLDLCLNISCIGLTYLLSPWAKHQSNKKVSNQVRSLNKSRFSLRGYIIIFVNNFFNMSIYLNFNQGMILLDLNMRGWLNSWTQWKVTNLSGYKPH